MHQGVQEQRTPEVQTDKTEVQYTKIVPYHQPGCYDRKRMPQYARVQLAANQVVTQRHDCVQRMHLHAHGLVLHPLHSHQC